MGFLAAKWFVPCVIAAGVAAQQREPAVVHGRAIDRDGKPVAGCAVGLFELGERFDTPALLAKPATTTDGAGRYRLEAKRDAYQVVVVTTKGHQVCVQRLQGEAGAVRHMPNALMLPGTTLRGRVRDAAGKPIAGALVRVEDPLTEGLFVMTWFESQAVSNERGIFEVPGVPRTGLRVTASALGFPGVSRLAAHDSPLDFTLSATGLVRGRVVDDVGKPVGGVKVNAITVELCDGAESVASDGDGRFTLTVPRAFRFRIAASEQGPPHRQFSSGLLRGPADDVEVVRIDAGPHEARRVTVRCIDAATKAPIEDFRASWSGAGMATWALLQRGKEHQAAAGEAVVDVHAVRDAGSGHVLVEAPGHGFAFVPVPAEPDAPFVIELPAECTLAGRVVDAGTGKPAAGCAVRALPTTSIVSSGGLDPWQSGAMQSGAITDADGRYRIRGLAPGKYDVQAYGVDRPASKSSRATVAAGTESTLDLEVPKARFLELEVVGEVPPGCLGSISLHGSMVYVGAIDGAIIESSLPEPPPVDLGEPRAHKLGPVGNGQFRATVVLPTRDRLGSALAIELGEILATPTRLQLPDLRQVLHSGRVRLPADVPPERVAVVAHRVSGGRRHDPMFPNSPFAVSLGSDGSFVIDLPPGRYALQLVDLETRLVFHTEEQDHTFDSTPSSIEIAPAIRWLTIELGPETAGVPVIVQYISIDIARARDDLPALIGLFDVSNRQQRGFMPCRANTSQLRWLVPATAFTLQAMQTFEILSPASSGWQSKPVDSAAVDAAEREPRVTLRIPAPPDDATILNPPKK